MRPRCSVLVLVVICLLVFIPLLGVRAGAQSSASLALDPNCGSETTNQENEPPYDIYVEGSEFASETEVEIYFDQSRQDRPDEPDVVADGDGSFSFTIHPARRTAGIYRIEAVQRDSEGQVQAQASADFAVPCPEPSPSPTATPSPSPTATPSRTPRPRPRPSPRPSPGSDGKRATPEVFLSPAVGRAGSVTIVSGNGFPPGARVVFTWRPGLGRVRSTADAAGEFSVQMVVFPNDVVGSRLVVAEGKGFRDAAAAFLVVPGTLQPPGFVVRR